MKKSIAPGDERQRLGRVPAVACAWFILPAPLAALQVFSIAEGSYKIDVLDDAALTFLIWMSVPLACGAGRLLRRTGFLAPAVGLVAAVASLTATLWVVRPQAPDGSGFDVSFETAMASLEADVEAALEQVFPGRWSPTSGFAYSPTLCVDQFGRDRGAGYDLVWYELEGDVDRGHFEAIDEVLETPDRRVEAPDFNRPARRLGQNHDKFVVRLEYLGERWIVELVTPCLRLE